MRCFRDSTRAATFTARTNRKHRPPTVASLFCALLSSNFFAAFANAGRLRADYDAAAAAAVAGRFLTTVGITPNACGRRGYVAQIRLRECRRPLEPPTNHRYLCACVCAASAQSSIALPRYKRANKQKLNDVAFAIGHTLGRARRVVVFLFFCDASPAR